jgi:hypothetical protein
MVRFMVLSAPRSASTWAANWLTTDRTLCLHDPILEHSPEDMDQLPCDRILGVACTGLALLPGFIRLHQARKVIVHRDLDEVNRSLVSIGLTPLGNVWNTALEQIQGMHVYYHDLFDPTHARRIYEHLTNLPFDAARHEQLCTMHVEPNFEKIKIKPERARDFRDRIHRAFH